MNTGVWIVPCAVPISPRRAEPSVPRSLNVSLFIALRALSVLGCRLIARCCHSIAVRAALDPANARSALTDNRQRGEAAVSLQFHLLDAHAARQRQHEAALLDRRVDLHVQELVTRLVAVALGVLELRRQVGLPVDENLDGTHPLRNGLALRGEAE